MAGVPRSRLAIVNPDDHGIRVGGTDIEFTIAGSVPKYAELDPFTVAEGGELLMAIEKSVRNTNPKAPASILVGGPTVAAESSACVFADRGGEERHFGSASARKAFDPNRLHVAGT